MGHLIIRIKKIKKDRQNMSEDEIKNKRLDYLKDLVKGIIDANKKLDDMPDLESEESATERQKGQGLKIFTPKQMITGLLILLAQLKAGNNSQKLKNNIIV